MTAKNFCILNKSTNKIILRYQNRMDAEKYIEGSIEGYKNQFTIVEIERYLTRESPKTYRDSSDDDDNNDEQREPRYDSTDLD